MWKTLTEFSIAVSVATRCMVWITIFLACVLALSFASSIISLMYEAALVRASSLRLSTSRLRASSALRPESSSNFSRSLVCILSSSSCLRAMSFFSFSMRCCPCSTSCLRRPISSIRWLSEISRCFSRFSFCWIFWLRCCTSFSNSAFLLRNFSFTSRSFFSFTTSASLLAASIISLYFPLMT